MVGAKVSKRDFALRCSVCRESLEPGWLWLGGSDYVKCPQCEGGYIRGVETRIEPTRKIFIPTRL